MMRAVIYMALFTLFSGFVSQNFSRSEYYPVFSGNSLEQMEQMSDYLAKCNTEKWDAYRGALLMKISGLQKGVSEKMNTFKSGRTLLEASIAENPGNVEWRFLRFTVQESAPAIVKYASNLEEDRKLITDNFAALDKDLQGYILAYAKTSKLLSVEELTK